MPQTAQTISSVAVTKRQNSDLSVADNHQNNVDNSAESIAGDHSHLSSVMSDLNQLSKSFVSSYQTLEGQVEQLNGQLQNISEQRTQAIEQKQQLIDEKQTITDRLQNLLAILPSGVVVLDGKGVVRDCNAVAIDILGRPLLGEFWLDVINRAFLPQADDGHQISLRDGRKVHIETRALDSEPGQMIVLTDMTKTRQLQSQLSQQQKLSSMGKMIASLAHQIRTPLSAAILYGSHINGDKISNDKKQQFSGFLLERLKFMERQISDMLNFVKGERKEKKPLNIADIVSEIRKACDALAHPFEFHVDNNASKDRQLIGDMDSLVGAVGNLVDNAIDASQPNSPVVINIQLKANDRLLIQIKDTGVGISEQQKKKLFEPFYSTKNHGNGLGLAIVHGIVIEHQGAISIDSNQSNQTDANNQQGSTFNLFLPSMVAEKTKSKTQSTVTQSINTGCIEDEVYGY